MISERKAKTPDRTILRLYTINNIHTKDIDKSKYGEWIIWYYQEYISRIGKESKSTDVFRQIRASNMGFAEVMFYMAGYYAAAYEKVKMVANEEKMKDGAYYFTTAEVKKDHVGSRAVGVMYHPDENAYVVYVAGRHRPKWESGVEEQLWDTTVTPAEKLYRNDHFYRSDEYQAILIAEEECVYLLVSGERTGGQKYLTLPSMYRRGFYWVPKNPFGVRLLAVMKEKKWKERMLKEILGDLYGTADVRTGIPHDAKDGEKQYLCFCVPDIEKLSGFLKYAEALSHPERNIILCFKEQRPLVEKVSNGFCTVQTVPDILPVVERRDDF